MSKQAKKGLVPELRFPAFRNKVGWEPQALESVGETINGLAGKTADDFGVGEPYVTYKQVFASSVVDLGLCSSVKVAEGERQNALAKGDVLLTTSSETPDEVGYASVLLTQPVRPTYLNSFCFAFRPINQKEHSPEFLRYLFHSPIYRKRVTLLAQGSTRYNISKGGFLGLSLPIPQERDEQKKVAACLSSLDALLAAEREKLEVLREHKKGLMQQLFPAEGAKLPALRFPGFGREWGAEPLGGYTLKVGSGITPRGGDKTYMKEGRIFIRSQNVGWGVLLLDEVAYIDEETHQTFPGTEIQLNDVLLNLSGASIGRCAVADERLVGGNVNQHVCIIRVNEDIHPVYLEQFILSKPGQKQIDSFQAGGNRQGLNYDQVRSFSIPLPADKNEQKEIALCLSAMDERIALQEERVGILEDHKKGLMQGLFPQTN